jgi:hypothetical protein
MKRLVLLIALLVIGCTNPFVKFYQDSPGGINLTRSPLVDLPTAEPKLYQGSDAKADHQSMLENGYNLVGFSSFNAANVNVKNALTQAKTVHAEIVLVYSKYTGTRSGVLPFTLPDTQTSTTTLSGSTNGSGSYGSFSGTARTTTYGSQTVYIPYSIDRFDCLATYWIKLKPPIFGVHVQDLTPEIRRIIGSNRGILVTAVIKNSPAFRADILKGDILRKIAGVDLYDPKSLREIIAKFEGQKIIVEILRDGKEFQKEIQLDQRR